MLLEQNREYTSRWGISTYALSNLIFIYSLHIRLIAGLGVEFFNYLGELSYPLYLFHVPSLIVCYSVLGI